MKGQCGLCDYAQKSALQVPVGPVRLSADDMLHCTVRRALSLLSLAF